MPTLRQLSYLVALSKELHFHRAAELMNVTQPTLSIQIKELEKQLKASLVERSQHNVMLTPLGREIAERARGILKEVEEIKSLSAGSQHGFEGTIRIGVPPTLGPYLLPHIVPELHATYPHLKLYVKEGKPQELQLDLKAGVHDIVFSPLPINHSDLVIANLFREPLKIATAADHRFVGTEKLVKEDLAGENVLTMERGHHFYDQVMQLCEDCDAKPLRDYEGTSLDTLRLMVGMGVGITVLPALYIKSEIGERGEIKVFDLETPKLYRQIGLTWRKRSVQSQLFNEIAEMVRKKAKEKLPEVTVLN
ncbi:LysR family transcriptional regulator [Sneathiella sp. P13V-1]|uniref:hydrogen peroxide-inducible genes activator n=1 Tax=Sneathiella sp. P13V-1 TaxID=2697366 RepID=UPI00187BAF7E|nr:hydrogen peroxide-inducible genes activator [Sneathiella sp. P13V-1]MBE7638234.1 LysR family transcriptional regulator [Sneathiella sp. P13V-1]